MFVFYMSGDKKIGKFLPVEKYFKDGVYMFDIGQNDLTAAFYSKASMDQAIPTILTEFEIGLQVSTSLFSLFNSTTS